MLPTTKTSDDPPAFGIIVYLLKSAEGNVTGRVANLEDTLVTAGSEREVLSRIVAACKQQLQEASNQGESPRWIDPPLPIAPGEQKRFLPMHL